LRSDGRAPDKLRPVRIERGWLPAAQGSVLIHTGRTRVLCAASITERVPDWLAASGQGWVTAEYGMLPASTGRRREGSRFRPDSRSQEIKRFIGRCLRAITDLDAIGRRTVWIDCDVIEADGGTRTASVTGAYIALHDALDKLAQKGGITKFPLTDSVAAVSVGLVDEKVLLDLDYREDSAAEVDMNIAMTGSGKFIEIQGTAEQDPFDTAVLDKMIGFARKGIGELTGFQRRCLGQDAVLSSPGDG